MYVTWEAVYRIADLLVQAGILLCAALTLYHMTKKK